MEGWASFRRCRYQEVRTLTRTVSVIVPSVGRASLSQCVSSLVAQTYPADSFEIIAVFDGGASPPLTEGATSRMPEEGPAIRFLYQRRQGPAAARNHGAGAARGEILAFIDDDCIADRDWLSNLVSGINRHAGVEGRVEPLEPLRPLAHWVANRGGLYLTANVAYERDWLERVGGFDERFRYPAGEDFDLAWKVLEAGGEIAYADGAIVYHPVRDETFGDFRRRLAAWDAPRLLAKKHPMKFREFTGRRWAAHSLYYTVVDPPYQMLRWRRELLRDPRAILQVLLRMSYQFLYGASQPIRRRLRRRADLRHAPMDGHDS